MSSRAQGTPAATSGTDKKASQGSASPEKRKERRKLDVVDTQVHLFFNMNEVQGLAAMDALGIRSMIIDEYWGEDADGNTLPGYAVADGVFRSVSPGAERASMLHPDRFAYVLRIDHRDPELEYLIRSAAAAPHVRLLRIDARKPADVQALADGEFKPFFAAAQRCGIPVCALTFGHAELLRPYIEAFGDLTIIVDHCGLPKSPEQFAATLELAAYKNVALKWAHAPSLFSNAVYPFTGVIPQLMRALDAFGRERIMWASDFTQARGGSTWGEILFYLRNATELSQEDKEWILGKSARKLLNWPLPA